VKPLSPAEVQELADQCRILEERLHLTEVREELQAERRLVHRQEELSAQQRSLHAAERAWRAQWEELRKRELRDATLGGAEPVLRCLKSQTRHARLVCKERLSETLAAHSRTTEARLTERLAEQREVAANEVSELRCEGGSELASKVRWFSCALAALCQETHVQRSELVGELESHAAAARQAAGLRCVSVRVAEVEGAELHESLESHVAQLAEELFAARCRADAAELGLAKSLQRLEAVDAECAMERVSLSAELAAATGWELNERAAREKRRVAEAELVEARTEYKAEAELVEVRRAIADARLGAKSIPRVATCWSDALRLSDERLAMGLEDTHCIAQALRTARFELKMAQEEAVRAEVILSACERRSEAQCQWATWVQERNAKRALS